MGRPELLPPSAWDEEEANRAEEIRHHHDFNFQKYSDHSKHEPPAHTKTTPPACLSPNKLVWWQMGKPRQGQQTASWWGEATQPPPASHIPTSSVELLCCCLALCDYCAGCEVTEWGPNRQLGRGAAPVLSAGVSVLHFPSCLQQSQQIGF